MLSFNVHSKLEKQNSLASLFKWGHWNMKTQCSLGKVRQLLTGRAGIQPKFCCIQNPMLCFWVCKSSTKWLFPQATHAKEMCQSTLERPEVPRPLLLVPVTLSCTTHSQQGKIPVTLSLRSRGRVGNWAHDLIKPQACTVLKRHRILQEYASLETQDVGNQQEAKQLSQRTRDRKASLWVFGHHVWMGRWVFV